MDPSKLEVSNLMCSLSVDKVLTASLETLTPAGSNIF